MSAIRVPLTFIAGAAFVLSASLAAAQADKPMSVMDLELGVHASEIPPREFADVACGTNGGPPSRFLDGWLDYGECPPDPATGLHEVYFRHDDEVEYFARAQRIDAPAVRFGSTTVFSVPVIASALFDDDGFMVGKRIVSDTRGMTIEIREYSISLWNFFRGRYGSDGFTCVNLEPEEGEQPYAGQFLKRRCEQTIEADGIHVTVEGHYYRKPGQAAVNPHTKQGTEGQFEIMVRLDVVMVDGVPDAEARLAALGVPEPDTRVADLMDCPGCDLAGADLKRADLRGANLAGAILAGANLHDARLDEANLADADLSQANLNKVQMKRANLKGANLSGAMMFRVKADGANFDGASLHGAMAGSIELIGASLREADVRLVEMRDSRLARADMTGADLSGSHLHNARAQGAVLADANLEAVVALDAQLTRANLSGANLRRADLYGADLRAANLARADLFRARLTRANMIDANLEGARLDQIDAR